MNITGQFSTVEMSSWDHNFGADGAIKLHSWTYHDVYVKANSSTTDSFVFMGQGFIFDASRSWTGVI